MPNFDAGHVLTIHTKNIDLRDFLKKRRVGDVERASGRLKDGAARNVVTILTGSVQADDETYPALDTLKTDKALATCAYSFLEDAMGRAPKAFKVRYTADSNTITNICETILLELRSNLGPNVGYNAAQPKAAPAELTLDDDGRQVAVTGTLARWVGHTTISAAKLRDATHALYVYEQITGITIDASVARTVDKTLRALEDTDHLGATKGGYELAKLVRAVDSAVKSTKTADEDGDANVSHHDRFDFNNPTRLIGTSEALGRGSRVSSHHEGNDEDYEILQLVAAKRTTGSGVSDIAIPLTNFISTLPFNELQELFAAFQPMGLTTKEESDFASKAKWVDHVLLCLARLIPNRAVWPTSPPMNYLSAARDIQTMIDSSRTQPPQSAPTPAPAAASAPTNFSQLEAMSAANSAEGTANWRGSIVLNNMQNGQIAILTGMPITDRITSVLTGQILNCGMVGCGGHHASSTCPTMPLSAAAAAASAANADSTTTLDATIRNLLLHTKLRVPGTMRTIKESMGGGQMTRALLDSTVGVINPSGEQFDIDSMPTTAGAPTAHDFAEKLLQGKYLDAYNVWLGGLCTRLVEASNMRRPSISAMRLQFSRAADLAAYGAAGSPPRLTASSNQTDCATLVGWADEAHSAYVAEPALNGLLTTGFGAATTSLRNQSFGEGAGADAVTFFTAECADKFTRIVQTAQTVRIAKAEHASSEGSDPKIAALVASNAAMLEKLKALEKAVKASDGNKRPRSPSPATGEHTTRNDYSGGAKRTVSFNQMPPIPSYLGGGALARGSGSSSSSSAQYATQGGGPAPGTAQADNKCFTCGMGGHFARDCPSNTARNSYSHGSSGGGSGGGANRFPSPFPAPRSS